LPLSKVDSFKLLKTVALTEVVVVVVVFFLIQKPLLITTKQSTRLLLLPFFGIFLNQIFMKNNQETFEALICSLV